MSAIMSEAGEPVPIEGERNGTGLGKDNGSIGVKKESDVTVKVELIECTVCLSRNVEQVDIAEGSTAGGTPLAEFLLRHTQASLSDGPAQPRHICRACLDLVNVLERAELEYIKVKEAFEAIISKNPLFEPRPSRPPLHVGKIKDEGPDRRPNSKADNDDSEDEPLALTKRKRRCKTENKRKKSVATSKRILRKGDSKENWACSECNASGKSGGQASLAAHILVIHAVPAQPVPGSVKKEESPDRSQSSMENVSDVFKLEELEDDDDDDDDCSSLLVEFMDKKSKKSPSTGKRKQNKPTNPTVKPKREKVLHYCDKCDAKYTSLVRLEQHKAKHDGSRPPYICEVCGARYKHKRACDIHVAMHRGISDWKCGECDKLFPSKGALQRHNNIHTGKLNYQCDLCGKSFIHTSSFKMHKLSHSGVKPHSCDVCGLALMTRSHLKRHKRVHSGEKRHECGACGKRFSERYNLLAHARSHDAPPAAAATAVAAPPRRWLFRCAFCVERFERRYMLERHCAVAHGRSVERPPPTPRNTMSKLLKAQAQRRDHAQPDDKRERSPDHKLSPNADHKTALQGASAGCAGAGSAGAALASAWAGAYAAEFGLRPQDYTH